MISVICVYNNKQQFDKQLCQSLNSQDCDYELIAIDNTSTRFKSASSALNYGAQKSKGEILVFSHQDIYFKTSLELNRFAKIIESLPKGTIVGTQGVKEPSKQYFTNLTSGLDYNSEIVNRYKDELFEVSCVDEGLFGMKKETWENHPFDEILCNNWHLYCVEQCLWNRKNGEKVYVYPLQLHHFSRGTITHSYMDNLRSICKKYRKDFKYVWTTCYKVRTNPLYINILVFLWKINRAIKSKGRR